MKDFKSFQVEPDIFSSNSLYAIVF